MTKISAKKHFGQHFLVNQGVISRIAEQVELLARKDDGDHFVLEIGPGQGALTEELLRRGLKVLAVELDFDMVEILTEKFSDAITSGKLRIVRQDALKLGSEHWQMCRVMCGNLPYNVGSAIVTRALKEWPIVRHFCFMLQKEVVEKYLASAGGDYGPASVRMQWMAEVGGHFWVKPGSFSPPPKVDSGVFWFTRQVDSKIPDRLEKRMGVVDGLFLKRRKMIRGSHSVLKDSPWAEKRPEEVSPDEFLRLTDLVLGSA